MLKPIIIKDKLQKSLLKDPKYEDDKSFRSPHDGDKTTILQETRVFSNSPLNTQKCLQILTKILHLINKGEERLSSQECTDIFFSITKLFQSNNERLRRMVYLLIKNLPVSEKEIFIVTSSLTKDMNSANDCYRANAIRVLSKIIDLSMATQIERYLKTAIVDKNSFVSCSALLCGLNLFSKVSADIVKKWVNEISECINNKNPMIQFHALALLCSIKFQDKLALEKIISSYNKVSSNLSSSLANCLLIKYATHLIYSTEVESGLNPMGKYNQAAYGNKDKYNMHDYTNTNKNYVHPTTKVCFDYLQNCLKSKDVMILYECIKSVFDLAICDVEGKNTTTVFNFDILTDSIKASQIFLLSSKIVDKFSIIRQLNKLSQHRPHVVAKINYDIENLLLDSNKNICVLAFTTLLKTGNESNIDKLLNQINTYMSGDNTFFKLQIIEELKNLCFVYPNKSNIILNFLANNLRDDESYQFKSNTIDAIILIISKIPSVEETAVLQLCEFIEDCEYNSLLLRVIRFLLLHIPKTKNPSKYIRYIYNRLILENPIIRVDGVYALFHIALKCAENSKDILFLLKCLLEDSDDEVRDRTNFFYYMLKEKIREMEMKNKQKNIKEGTNKGGITTTTTPDSSVVSTPYENGIPAGTKKQEATSIYNEKENVSHFIDELLTNEEPADLDNLIYFITNHIKENQHEEFEYENLKNDMKKRSSMEMSKDTGIIRKKSLNMDMINNIASLKSVEAVADLTCSEEVSYFVEKYKIGNLKVVNKLIPLTEREAEYTVSVKKLIYENFIILEFNVHNTLCEQILSNVSLHLNSFESNWLIVEQTTIANLFYNVPKNIYFLLKKKAPFNSSEVEMDIYNVSQHFQVSLHFLAKENETDEGFLDSYSVNPFSIQITDFIVPKPLRDGEFKHLWDNMENLQSEVVSKFSLNFENIQLAVLGLLNTLNMTALNNTGQVENNSTSHNMILSAKFLNESMILCKASLILSQQYGCLLKIVCRSKNRTLSDYILKSLE